MKLIVFWFALLLIWGGYWLRDRDRSSGLMTGVSAIFLTMSILDRPKPSASGSEPKADAAKDGGK